MTAFEIVLIFIGVVAVLISFGRLVVALRAFLDKTKTSENKKAYPV